MNDNEQNDSIFEERYPSSEPKSSNLPGILGKVGCGVATAVIGICIGMFICLFGVLAFGFNSVRNSEPYQLALTTAQQSETAVLLLGEPIEPGFLFSGSFSVSGPDGDAEYSIPVSGPRGSGQLHARAIKTNNVWELNTLILETDTERLPLIRER